MSIDKNRTHDMLRNVTQQVDHLNHDATRAINKIARKVCLNGFKLILLINLTILLRH